MDRQGNTEVSDISSQIKNSQLFLFDLDGTLIDSSKDIAEAVNYALEKLGIHPKPENEIIKHVGYGGRKLMEGVLGTADEELLEESVKLFREYYFSNPVKYTQLYPYVVELLQKLKEEGKKTAVVTNKYEDISRQIIEKLGIDRLIDAVVGGDTTQQKKPHPQPVVYAVKLLGGTPEKAVMVGDSETDIKSGKSAGTKTVLVTYGFGKTDLALQENPDLIIGSLKELL
ncbi:HAD family hydrolase [Persephonella sp.]